MTGVSLHVSRPAGWIFLTDTAVVCREHGPLSLVNRRRGQPGNRQLMPGLAERALGIIRERYADFGPTLAWEKLSEVSGQRDGTQAETRQ